MKALLVYAVASVASPVLTPFVSDLIRVCSSLCKPAAAQVLLQLAKSMRYIAFPAWGFDLTSMCNLKLPVLMLQVLVQAFHGN